MEPKIVAGLYVFDDTIAVTEVKVPVKLTAQDIDNILVTAFEGGISYWGYLRKNGNFENKPITVPAAQWATKILLEGKQIVIYDTEEEREMVLTMKKLKNGIRLNAKERPHDWDINEGDADTADCIIQYALFGRVIYG